MFANRQVLRGSLFGLVLLVGALFFGMREARPQPPQRPSPTAPVLVVNKVSEAVPVVVLNSASGPIEVRSLTDLGEPVHLRFFAEALGGNFIQTNVYTVPVDKRLVMEDLSVSANVLSGERAFVWLNLPGGGERSVTVFPQGTFLGQDRFAGSEHVRLGIPPGQRISFHLLRSDEFQSNGRYSLFGTISGTLVNHSPE